MSKNKKSRFNVGDFAILSHSTCGLLENPLNNATTIKNN